MITVIVKYTIAGNPPREQVAPMLKQGAETMFKGMPHLYSKQFCYDESQGLGLSVYLWDSRANAEAFFNEAFLEEFKKNMGCVPEVALYDNLVTVDNRAGDLLCERPS
jgi:hypothetical protein